MHDESRLVYDVTLENGSLAKLRPIDFSTDLQAFMVLQTAIWGTGGGAEIPYSLLKVIAGYGGVVAGAFDETDALMGFVISLPAVVGKESVNWSYRLGIRASSRNLKLGSHLKAYQKKQCLQMGFSTIYWSFDPLESKNAYFNLMKLGGEIVGYERDFYKESRSSLHQLLPTDRLLLKWSLAYPKPYDEPTIAFKKCAVYEAGMAKVPAWVRVGVPDDIQDIKDREIETAKLAAKLLRSAFEKLLSSHDISYFYREASSGYCYYVFEEKNND